MSGAKSQRFYVNTLNVRFLTDVKLAMLRFPNTDVFDSGLIALSSDEMFRTKVYVRCPRSTVLRK